MGIEEKLQQRQKALEVLYPYADDYTKQKTQAELSLPGYNLHYNFIRFALSLLSFALYIPTIIELFMASTNGMDYIRTIIIVIMLALLEIGLAYSLFTYYTRKHSKNPVNKSAKYIAFGLAFVSAISSALSGVNTVSITDNSQEKIIEQTKTDKSDDLKDYYNMLNRNDQLIGENAKLIRENNILIHNLKDIAATKGGKAQIASYQARNKELQAQSSKLLDENTGIRQEISKSRTESTGLMQNRLQKAGKKELIYMLIFFLAGIVACGGLMFSYNFIGKFYFYLAQDAPKIEALQDMWTERIDDEVRTKEKRAVITKEMQLRTKNLDKALRQADNDDDEENDESQWTSAQELPEKKNLRKLI